MVTRIFYLFILLLTEHILHLKLNAVDYYTFHNVSNMRLIHYKHLALVHITNFYVKGRRKKNWSRLSQSLRFSHKKNKNAFYMNSFAFESVQLNRRYYAIFKKLTFNFFITHKYSKLITFHHSQFCNVTFSGKFSFTKSMIETNFVRNESIKTFIATDRFNITSS